MVGFYIETEIDPTHRSNEFVELIRGEKGIGARLDSILGGKNYGNDAKLFLIMWFVEGTESMPLPEKIRASYSKKEKALSTRVSVLRRDFFSGQSHLDRCAFVVAGIFSSLEVARLLCERRGLDVDMKTLMQDVHHATDLWQEDHKKQAST